IRVANGRQHSTRSTPFTASSNRRSFYLLLAGFNSTWRTWILMEQVTALYLWKAKQRSRHWRLWVHQNLQRRNQFGEYHHLLQEQRLDDGLSVVLLPIQDPV
ncbi:hypothetical protein AMECASPLE_038564, partial [Ameca splendens]